MVVEGSEIEFVTTVAIKNFPIIIGNYGKVRYVLEEGNTHNRRWTLRVHRLILLPFHFF